MRGYDYSLAGAYFVTICAQHRACLFGEIANGEMCLNDAGRSIHQHCVDIAARFPTTDVESVVVMPNHIHGIVLINDPHPDESGPPNRVTLSEIVHGFKTGTTYDYVQGVNTHGWPPFDRRLWQRNYYEHFIRNDSDYERIAAYIEANPSLWQDDALHPTAPEFQAKGHVNHRRTSRETS